MCALVVCAFALGGGARADLFSLVVLRPLAALALAYGLLKLHPQQVRDYRTLFIFSAAVLALVLLHLIPLPPALWTQLPGREIIEEIDAAAGLSGVWRPLGMVPQDGWNAAFSLLVPFAVLVLAVRLGNSQQRLLAYLLVLVAFGSILVGLLQLQGPPGGSLYFYRITNEGKMVGLFSNRNHNAIFLSAILPIFGYICSLDVRGRPQMNMRLALSVIGAICILAALVIIGARAGFVFGIMGLLGAIALYRSPKILSRRHSDPKKPSFVARHGKAICFALVGAAALGLLVFSQSETMQRMQDTESTEEIRLKVVGPILAMTWKYFPFGSGVGSFVEVYRIDEPLALLDPHYLNHAHNDLLEILLTAGLPGALLVVAAVLCWAAASWRVFRRSPAQDENILRARLGATIMGLLALASLVDYPLRTPSLACLFVIASVWLGRGMLRFEPPVGRRENA